MDSSPYAGIDANHRAGHPNSSIYTRRAASKTGRLYSSAQTQRRARETCPESTPAIGGIEKGGGLTARCSFPNSNPRPDTHPELKTPSMSSLNISQPGEARQGNLVAHGGRNRANPSVDTHSKEEPPPCKSKETVSPRQPPLYTVLGNVRKMPNGGGPQRPTSPKCQFSIFFRFLLFRHVVWRPTTNPDSHWENETAAGKVGD